MQNDFVDGALGTPEARAVVPAVQELLERERGAGSDVAFTMDTHGADYLSTQEGRLLPVPHCIRGTHGWQIIPPLQTGDVRIFEKGAFGSVELARFARP